MRLFRGSQNRCGLLITGVWSVVTDGLSVFVSQGFGSGCDGVGGALTARRHTHTHTHTHIHTHIHTHTLKDWCQKAGPTEAVGSNKDD